MAHLPNQHGSCFCQLGAGGLCPFGFCESHLGISELEELDDELDGKMFTGNPNHPIHHPISW